MDEHYDLTETRTENSDIIQGLKHFMNTKEGLKDSLALKDNHFIKMKITRWMNKPVPKSFLFDFKSDE